MHDVLLAATDRQGFGQLFQQCDPMAFAFFVVSFFKAANGILGDQAVSMEANEQIGKLALDVGE